jgi:hypothetical protein
VIGAAIVAVPVLTASPAAASSPTSIDLYPNESWNQPTWFFGRTTICFQNNNDDAWSVLGNSAFYYWTPTISPHTTQCTTRSFVGLAFYVMASPRGANALASETIHMYMPYGPAIW